MYSLGRGLALYLFLLAPAMLHAQNQCPPPDSSHSIDKIINDRTPASSIPSPTRFFVVGDIPSDEIEKLSKDLSSFDSLMKPAFDRPRENIVVFVRVRDEWDYGASGEADPGSYIDLNVRKSAQNKSFHTSLRGILIHEYAHQYTFANLTSNLKDPVSGKSIGDLMELNNDFNDNLAMRWKRHLELTQGDPARSATAPREVLLASKGPKKVYYYPVELIGFYKHRRLQMADELFADTALVAWTMDPSAPSATILINLTENEKKEPRIQKIAKARDFIGEVVHSSHSENLLFMARARREVWSDYLSKMKDAKDRAFFLKDLHQAIRQTFASAKDGDLENEIMTALRKIRANGDKN